MGVARVVGVYLGDGGVPKRPVAAADVSTEGIAGDRHKVRRIHGGPTRALCLWSADVLQELIDEGHPLFGGACGENVLVTGIDWTLLKIGDRLTLGPVLAELTEATTPCRQIRPYFANNTIQRVSHTKYPGSGRWYARILVPGPLAVGDAVSFTPAATPTPHGSSGSQITLV